MFHRNRRRLLILVIATCALALRVNATPTSTGDSPPGIVGPGIGALVAAEQARDCGVVAMHADDTYYAGFAWSGEGVALPYYGAFAECYSVPGPICGIVLDLTQTGGQEGQTCDLYVWADDNGVPGQVLAVRTGVDPGPIAMWPEVSRHILPMPETAVEGTYWVGFWGNWVDGAAGWYVAADGESFENGCPLTNVAPNLEFPKGWSNVDIPFSHADALGIGVEVAVDEPIGACCLPNHACVVDLESRCLGAGGIFQGSGVPCTPDLCLPATGACCLGQNCIVTTLDDCSQHDGRFIGNGSSCVTNPCEVAGIDESPPQVRHTTWGRIKAEAAGGQDGATPEGP
jgi:hypothetical protein